MKTALVTGGAGFVAGHLLRCLRKAGIGTIAGADIRPPPHSGFDAFELVDLTDGAVTTALLKRVRPDVVFHLAGTVGGSARTIHASNVETTRVLLETARSVAPETRLVLVGSAAEYGTVPSALQPVHEEYRGTPLTAYGRAKAAVTALAARAHREWNAIAVVARPFNIVGPGVPETLVTGAVIQRLRAALSGPPPYRVRIGRTDSIRDFVAVEDVAEGLMAGARQGTPGRTYNLCSGDGRSIRWLVDRLIGLTGTDISLEQDLALTRTDEADVMIGCPERAQRELGWEARRSIEDSLRAAWQCTEPIARVD